MFSQFRASLIAVFIIGFALLSASAQAQDRFHLYLDVDNNPNTGCSEAFPNAPGTASGGEIRLTAVVDGQPPQVIDVIMESCSGGGTFGSGGVSIGGGYPVALNVGVDGADAIELSIAAGTVGIPSIRALGLQLAARSERGNEDVLLTRDGSPDGGPIVFGIPFSVPVAGLGGLVLLGGVVVLLGLRARRQLHRRALLSVGMLLWVGVAVAGGAFMADGDISEWGGTPSIATDPAGDVSGSDDAADLRALFVALDGNELFFRIDVTDLENLPPVANPQAVSTLEDQALVITLSGSDPNGDPLSFAITTGPTQGTLGPVTQLTPTSAQVTYTPNADYFGADSLAFIVNDGQVNSPPATVSITVDPVNDAPSFIAASPAAVNEDAG
ncbi:MAG: cadherin-like domain-containing protein, partial [Xanthomonadales bacterium]|nr:cadherin-like domain-containing protein [Xanthomonadales bacterium]